MGATTRYGFRWPANTAASTIWTWIQNLAEDVEGRLATIEDASGGIARKSGAAFSGDVAAPQFRFANTGSEVVLSQESAVPPVMAVLNPGASLWATIKAGAFAVQSSLRYKQNVRPTRYGLRALLSLRVVDFEYREGHGDPIIPQTGLIAEEVAGLFPEAVTYDGNGEPDGLDLAKLLPLAIVALQELAERVDRLES